MKGFLKTLGSLVVVGILSVTLVAQTSSAARYDRDIQSRVAQQLADKKEFRNLQSSVDDGIVTLTGSVDLYQQKLDAAKKVRKMDKVQGVRNLIEVSSTALDAQLAAQLDRKLYFDRIGYGNQFNYITASVQDGVATLSGETRTDVDRDSALWIAGNMPGVKEVVNDIRVAPVSNFDDDIRLRALRVIYRDPVLGRYASDPAAPIRIVVSNGKLILYGTVENTMDKNVAGIRAGQISGVFSVQNNLEVAKKS
ncbi:MAG: BON domain-containing protein [Acidobacteriia bacterium]|nr:BON domain-containing protein [Terriglobia bacterium]